MENLTHPSFPFVAPKEISFLLRLLYKAQPVLCPEGDKLLIPGFPSIPSFPGFPASPFGPCLPSGPIGPVSPCGPLSPCGPGTAIYESGCYRSYGLARLF